LSCSFALIDPGGLTGYLALDRAELVYTLSGRGISICEGEMEQGILFARRLDTISSRIGVISCRFRRHDTF
jgi:hypothetical protein